MNNIYDIYITNRYNNTKLLHEHIGGNNSSKFYNCYPENNYNNICKQEKNGIYESKYNCMLECESRYINRHLIQANIKNETVKFYLFIRHIINKEKMSVYIKGGSVIGLYILKLINNKYKNNRKKFKRRLKEFINLKLMKDWDFAAYTKQSKTGDYYQITQSYRDKLDSIANKYNLVPKAKNFVLYRTKRPILINNEPFFEIAILDSDNISTLELPMTSMKVKVTMRNIKYIYMFAKYFYSYIATDDDIDSDILMKMINKIDIIVHPHKKGLYNPKTKIDQGGLTSQLISFINRFSKGDNLISQFFVIHIQDPYRLLYRLPEKNIPKTKKIKKFIKNNLNVQLPSWLIDTERITKLIEDFSIHLGQKLLDLYNKNGITSVSNFMKGVLFNRTRIECKKFTDSNIKILNNIIKPLMDKMILDNNNIQVHDKNDIINFINFVRFCKDKILN